MQLVIISSKSLYCNIPVYFFLNVKNYNTKQLKKHTFQCVQILKCWSNVINTAHEPTHMAQLSKLMHHVA